MLVVLSDAETLPFRTRIVAADLRRAHVKLVVVRFWRPDERVYRRDGRRSATARARRTSSSACARAGWTAFDETQFAAVRDLVAETMGHGPVQRVAFERLDRGSPVVARAARAPPARSSCSRRCSRYGCPLWRSAVPTGPLPAAVPAPAAE